MNASLRSIKLHDCVHDFSLHTQHCRHVHSHYWSGVFNLLKFDHTLKKKKKKLPINEHNNDDDDSINDEWVNK